MLNRRDFARLATASAVTAALPSSLLAQAAPQRKIRYAAVGLGRISVDHFMPGTRMSRMGQITGLVSGDPAKARKLAADYNVPESSIYSYADYDRIAQDPNIDAVYIGLPNSMHAEYTIRAAQAGKHVLCEKPMASSVADSEAMVAACKKANKLLMIAYRIHLQPTYMQARDLLRSGALGKVQAIESANGFSESLGEWRLNKKLAGGGPLMDVGIYSLNTIRFVLGEEPSAISAYVTTPDANDPRFKEVEENVAWTMKFPSGAVASCNTTYGAPMNGYMRIHCSRGEIVLNGFGYDGISMEVRSGGETRTEADNRRDPAQFLTQSDYFSNCILTNTQPEPSGEEGVRDMRLMAEIYRSGGRPL